MDNAKELRPNGLRTGSEWRRSRLAARLILSGRSTPLSPLRAAIAARLAEDPTATNRLIQHGIDWLRGRAERIRREQQGSHQ